MDFTNCRYLSLIPVDVQALGAEYDKVDSTSGNYCVASEYHIVVDCSAVGGKNARPGVSMHSAAYLPCNQKTNLTS